jgi:uncharacterized protein
MTLRLIKLLSLSIFISLFLLVKSVFAYPEPVGFVNDFADVLSDEFEESLETKLTSFSDQQGPEVVIVTIESLEEDAIENYAEELFSEWGIGKKDEDNGVLFLAAISDRKMRIEVGYGAEALLNDAKAGRIIRDTIAPEFKDEDYEAGIEKGADKIIASLNSEDSAEPTVSEEISPSSILPLIIFAAIFSYLAAFLARSKSWWAGGVIGFIIGIFTSLIVALIFAVIGLLFDFILSSNYRKLKKAKKPTGFWSSRGGFWTGGGSSGGGFGGGSSGGGGASGGW